MNTTSIGESELNYSELEVISDYVTDSIYDYEQGAYEGSGTLIGVGEEGIWCHIDLGHCSCYGPLENGYSGKFTKEEILILIEKHKLDNSFKEFVLNFKK